MYEYAPQFPKKREKMLALGIGATSLLFYVTSLIEGVPIPALLQLLAVCGFVAVVMLISLYILRRYSYRVEYRERAEIGSVPDLIITEQYSRRTTVVCRVSVSSVRAVMPVNGETQKKINAEKHAHKLYRYAGVLFGEEQYYLAIEENGELFYVHLCADAELIRLLSPN
ncbi:MAG: hypothetical protein IJW92_09675 [Clostridia bacterium]|nr:hypothetical protein [Clostridia bacterium]